MACGPRRAARAPGGADRHLANDGLLERGGDRATALAVVLVGGDRVLLPERQRDVVEAVEQPVLDLRHPGVRKILKLYAPVALGIAFSVIGIVLDRNLASHVGDNALTIMRYATTLIQFPLGLVATAVSFAVLPTLSRQASAGDDQAFGEGLAQETEAPGPERVSVTVRRLTNS